MILDPSTLLGNAISGAIGAPIVIGLPSPQAPVPNFVIGIQPKEEFESSSTLPVFQLTPGDLFMKSAINGSRYSFDFVVSETADIPTSWLSGVATAIQQITSVSNQLANFGSVIPNLAGVSANYAMSQLATLRNMRIGTQPILLLNSFVSLGAISQNNPYLSSNWYIESMGAPREEGDRGMVVTINLKEVLVKRDPTVGVKSLLVNFGNEIVGPGVGNSVASLL